MNKAENLLALANQRLKDSNAGIIIEKRGSKLSLRGMLPPKEGQGKPYQQRISLGIYGNPYGIKVAEKQAQKIASLLALNQFSWDEYSKVPPKKQESVEFFVEKFEEHYFNKKARTPESETTWKTDYRAVFKTLPSDRALSADLLMKAILATTPDSRTRKRFCIAISAIAEFAGIDFDPSEMSGNYSPNSVRPRDIPSDEEILKFYDSIPETYGWKYAYALMACYGLRNHEIFHLDLNSLVKNPGHALVLGGKTGSRQVWCLYPEWHDRFEIANISRPFPQVSGSSNSDLGHRVSQAFRRYKVCQPYNLRHAWAIRSILFNLPVELAASMMGHSVKVHCETYQKWLNDAYYQKIYELFILRGDRPVAP